MAARLIARINIGIRREQSASLLPDAVKGKLGWTLGKCLLRGTAAGTCGFTLEYVARTRWSFICGRSIPVSEDPVSRRREYLIRVPLSLPYLKVSSI